MFYKLCIVAHIPRLHLQTFCLWIMFCRNLDNFAGVNIHALYTTQPTQDSIMSTMCTRQQIADAIADAKRDHDKRVEEARRRAAARTDSDVFWDPFQAQWKTGFGSFERAVDLTPAQIKHLYGSASGGGCM